MPRAPGELASRSPFGVLRHTARENAPWRLPARRGATRRSQRHAARRSTRDSPPLRHVMQNEGGTYATAPFIDRCSRWRPASGAGTRTTHSVFFTTNGGGSPRAARWCAPTRDASRRLRPLPPASRRRPRRLHRLGSSPDRYTAAGRYRRRHAAAGPMEAHLRRGLSGTRHGSAVADVPPFRCVRSDCRTSGWLRRSAHASSLLAGYTDPWCLLPTCFSKRVFVPAVWRIG